jgi:AbrB family looped-hinge helix DNA binding protein
MRKRVRLSSKHQITIPRALCDKLEIRAGQELLIECQDGRLVIWAKPAKYSEALEGLGKKFWKGVDPLGYVRRQRASWT